MSRALLALAFGLAFALPGVAHATPAPASDVYAFADPQGSGSIFAEVHYSDGLASTKFSFLQLAGAAGGPGQRFKPTASCTEWIGTFDTAVLEAGPGDHVANSTVRILGFSAGTGTGRYDDAPFNMTAGSTPGGMTGSLLICDQPGDGLARFSLAPATTLSAAATPLVVRMALEGSA